MISHVQVWRATLKTSFQSSALPTLQICFWYPTPSEHLCKPFIHFIHLQAPSSDMNCHLASQLTFSETSYCTRSPTMSLFQPLFEISAWRVWGLWTWFLHGCFAVFRCCAFLPLLSQSHNMVLLFLFRFDFSCLFGLILCSAIFCSFLFFLLCLVVLFAESAFLRFPAFLQQSKQHNNQSSKLHKARIWSFWPLRPF